MAGFFEARDLLMTFGGLTAVRGFSLSLAPGELVGLIGPNGAGKTTVFNIITGFLKPKAGFISWGNRQLVGLDPHQITASGIARTFQNIRLYSDMTVSENVMVSYHYRLRAHFWDAMLNLPLYRREERKIREQSLDLLSELGLSHLQSEKAGSLPYGQQRRLEIARALATSPQLLLLDEPAAGMNPHESLELSRLITSIRKKYGLTILLIEHDMKFVMGICERIKVLDHGIPIAEGTPSEIRENDVVIKAYLGGRSHARDH